MALKPEQLIGEVDDLLRSAPSPETMRDPQNLEWLGRAAAVLRQWRPNDPFLLTLLDDVQEMSDYKSRQGGMRLLRWLHDARADLRLQIPGLTSIAIGKGLMFSYFDEIRKLIELARVYVLFIDR